MDELVGRIFWNAGQITDDSRASGETPISLGGVAIERLQQTRRDTLITEAASEFKANVIGRAEEFSAVIEEIRLRSSTEEDLDRVVKIWFKKSARLNEQVALGLSETLDHQSGFGIVAEVAGERLFCWEWFIVANGGHAKKLQETGEIYYETTTTGSGEEIAYMRFESDVPIRLMPFAMPPSLEPSWRIDVLKGSEIYWPFLGDGEIQATGFL
jgi:hypothetical protein